MKWTYEQLNPLGVWQKVETDEPPIVMNGRLKLAEDQGPKVRNVSLVGTDHNPA